MPTIVSCEIDTLVGTEAIRRVGDTMLAALGLDDAELSIVLTDDDGIRELNTEHRGEARATDVLAFPMDFIADEEPLDGERLLGDVVISIPTAARQAARSGHSLAVEVRFLLAHGVLHLIGLDHRDASEKAEMDAATARLLAADEKK